MIKVISIQNPVAPTSISAFYAGAHERERYTFWNGFQLYGISKFIII